MSNKDDNNNGILFLPIGMCIGMSLGVAFGAAFDNIPIGMCLGLGCGSAIGSMISVAMSKVKKSEDDETDENKDE